MLIALIGPTSAGKLEVAKYLVVHHNFRPAFIASQNNTDAASHGQALLDHVTFNWRDNIVTLDLLTRQDLEIGFDKRPFFLLVGVDAPVMIRFRRMAACMQAFEHVLEDDKRQLSLEKFLAEDDANLYGLGKQSAAAIQDKADSNSLPATPSKVSQKMNVVQPNGLLASRSAPSSLRELMQTSTIIINNQFQTIASLHSHLASLSLSSPQRLRPSWDTYFLSLCTLASLRSNCMKRRVGAVLVRNNRVLSTGYNGTPRGLINCADGGCSRCNGAAAGGTALDECLCLHAEENALLECGRERGGADGTVLYCNTCPCLRCAVKIVQTGVREVVYQLAYSMDDRSRKIFQEANVLFRQYHPM
ncbi:uncharacterized protein FA14DRAFT_116879 [Meira miltonrushii]|uniref:Deoxycytidylate deaminase n=1 Tax=Meira miltonrushii TaxID=1280837 RepID=A0A316VKU5_9BASI|nr:uncharacterized protein FA14DRAFT_116879 [Meira miltonrushii]PWN37884.1 hypothetical protein FA14DRAFT_116879 [Meira miltonrushii]